jgi:lipoprotein-releasing system permease protein
VSTASVERLVAWRLLRARHKESFISAIAVISLVGVAIGVTVLIIVLSVMNGFRADIYARNVGLNGHITVNAAKGPLTDFDALAARLRQTPGVVAVIPVVEGEVMAIDRGNAKGALLRGMRLEDLQARPNLAHGIVQGQLATIADNGGLVLGERLRRDLNVGIGSIITLMSPQGGGDQPLEPKNDDFTVDASFSVRMQEIDSSYIFMPLDAAQLYFNLESNQVTGLDLLIANIDDARQLADTLRRELGNGYKVSDWQQRNAAFVDALKVERAVMFVILSLIILVAALNILASFSMLVRTKSRSIAILRSMGITRGGVLRVFLMAGGAVGVIGAAIGAALGLLFCLNIRGINDFFAGLKAQGIGGDLAGFFANMPAVLRWSDVITVLLVALLLSLAAAAYVAVRAASLEPAEALRYE